MTRQDTSHTVKAETAELDKEIADVLIAISVLTRQLSKRISENHKTKEDK